MITTDNEDSARQLRLLRHQAMSISDVSRHQAKKVLSEQYNDIGYNYRMTDIQAAIGLEQLKKLPGIVRKRRALAKIYQQELSSIPWLEAPKEPRYAKCNWQSFPVHLLDNAPITRDDLMQRLLDEGVSTRPGIMNIHQEKPYADKVWDLSESEKARDSVILLPFYYEMTENEVKEVVDQLKNV